MHAVPLLLPLFAYCMVQTFRDVRGRRWAFALWGGATTIFIGWLLEALTRAPPY